MKSIYYTISVAGKEIRLIVADRGLLAVLLLLPILLGSLFAGLNLMAANEEGDPNILLEVILVNEDPGVFGGEVAKSIKSIEQLNVDQTGTVSAAEQRVEVLQPFGEGIWHRGGYGIGIHTPPSAIHDQRTFPVLGGGPHLPAHGVVALHLHAFRDLRGAG